MRKSGIKFKLLQQFFTLVFHIRIINPKKKNITIIYYNNNNNTTITTNNNTIGGNNNNNFSNETNLKININGKDKISKSVTSDRFSLENNYFLG